MFNEKEKEWSKKQSKEIEVWQSPKYVEARDKAIELIESKKYGLTEGDFWILMNETKTGKMGYSGLIISHNGCLKINDKAENKVKPESFTVIAEGYNKSLVYTYCDNDIYEVGEVSKDNCTNAYPYAMAYKRCFDRVVLKKCKLAYAGVYSDSEAEEFSNNKPEEDIENEKISKTHEEALRDFIKNNKISDDIVIELLHKKGYSKLSEIKMVDYMPIQNQLEKIIKE